MMIKKKGSVCLFLQHLCVNYLDGLNLHLLQTRDGAPNSDSRRGVENVGSSGDGLLALLAVPDSGDGPLDGVFTAEGAVVLAVLGDLHLLDELSEGGSVAGSVLSRDSDLFRALSHFGKC